MRRAAQASSVRKDAGFPLWKEKSTLADNAGKKTFRAAMFPENEHCMGISEQTVPECGIDDTSDRFLAADMESSLGLRSIHWKRNPVFTEKE